MASWINPKLFSLCFLLFNFYVEVWNINAWPAACCLLCCVYLLIPPSLLCYAIVVVSMSLATCLLRLLCVLRRLPFRLMLHLPVASLVSSSCLLSHVSFAEWKFNSSWPLLLGSYDILYIVFVKGLALSTWGLCLSATTRSMANIVDEIKLIDGLNLAFIMLST